MIMQDTDRHRQDDDPAIGDTQDAAPAGKRRPEDLPPAAQRALKEAEERRKRQPAASARPKEVGGRGGEDPARYGDWEIKGRAIDF